MFHIRSAAEYRREVVLGVDDEEDCVRGEEGRAIIARQLVWPHRPREIPHLFIFVGQKASIETVSQ